MRAVVTPHNTMSITAQASLNKSSQHGIDMWFITLTDSTGFDPEEFEDMSAFLDVKFERGLGVREAHQSGLLHVHLLVYDPVKRGCQVTEKFRVYYKKAGHELSHNAIVTKRVTNFQGICNYVMKDVTEENPVFWIRGYTWTWIQEQAVQGKLNRPKSVILKDRKFFTATTAVPIMLNYAKAIDLTISSEKDVLLLIKSMMRAKYVFTNIFGKLRGITAQILVESNADDAELDSIIYHAMGYCRPS